MNRGLYGSLEGNEKRLATDCMASQIDANETVEGDEVATLRRMASEQDWNAFQAFCGKLKAKGHAQFRIDSMVVRAMAGVRL